MKKIERVGIVIKPHAPEIQKVLKELISYFDTKGIACGLEDIAAQKLNIKGGIPRKNIPAQVDLVIVLGGDGTLLSIAYLAAQENVPVLGVNLGSLGFLTEVPLEEMFLTLDAFLGGNEEIISPRQMLQASTKRKVYYSLNDVVVNKGALSRMIQCGIWIDGKEIAATRADGLIVSTPTGSTAYSLSAGGPIIYPHIPAFVISPICPHTLSFRPMVVSSESRIQVKLLNADRDAYLTIDGQRGELVAENDVVDIRCCDYKLHLISSPKRNYFDLLKEKLGWG